MYDSSGVSWTEAASPAPVCWDCWDYSANLLWRTSGLVMGWKMIVIQLNRVRGETIKCSADKKRDLLKINSAAHGEPVRPG